MFLPLFSKETGNKQSFNTGVEAHLNLFRPKNLLQAPENDKGANTSRLSPIIVEDIAELNLTSSPSKTYIKTMDAEVMRVQWDRLVAVRNHVRITNKNKNIILKRQTESTLT